MRRSFLLAPLLLLVTCSPWQEVREAFDPDLQPPVLVELRVADGDTLELRFDEAVRSPPDALLIVPELPVSSVSASGTVLQVDVSEQQPGARYTLEATVSDEEGNALSFLAEFYGHNPEVPDMRINEFTTRGSGNHPDVVELAVLGGGNMGGVVLVHFRPQGLPEEVDESGDPAVSGGCDASEEAWDFWVPGGAGLSGNNGVLSLYTCPGGSIADGVLYSNRTAASDELCGGFGTRDAWERAQELVRDGGWRIAGEVVRPEDAVSPEGSTGTRSICRNAASTDTDRATDWHIVPTLGFSFGGKNSEEVHSPP
jgi:hypothetical protein